MWRTIALACLLNLVLAVGLTVGSPYIVTEHLGLSNQFMGIAEASLGLGGLAGSALVTIRPNRFVLARMPRYVLAAACCAAPMAVALLAKLPATLTFLIMVPCLAGMFGFCSCVSIVFMSYLQRETPSDLVGKVMALMFAAVNCATPLGQLVYGIAYDALTPAIITFAMIAGVVALAGALWASLRREGVSG